MEEGLLWEKCDKLAHFMRCNWLGEKTTVQSVSLTCCKSTALTGEIVSPLHSLPFMGTPIYGPVQYRASLCISVHCIEPSCINDSFIWHLVYSSLSPSRFGKCYIFTSFFFGGSVLKGKHHKLYFPMHNCHNEFHYTVSWTCLFFYIGPYFLLKDEGPVELIISLHFHT